MASIIKVFGSSSKMKMLNVARNEFVGAYFASRPETNATFAALCELNLSECGINPDSCSGLAEFIQSITAPNLILNLNNNPIGAKGMAILSSHVNQETIKTLYVSNCGLGDDGLQSIIDACTENRLSGLRVLDASKNGISPKGIQYIASRLEEGHSCFSQLEELNFASNHLDESSVYSLAKALEKRRMDGATALKALDLSETNCTVIGAKSIIQMVGLEDLRLFNNDLGNEGFVEIGNVLKGGHSSLKTLDLGGNRANEASVASVLQAVSAKEPLENTLKVLVVGGNEGGPIVERMVKEVKRSHPEIDIARDRPPREDFASDLIT